MIFIVLGAGLAIGLGAIGSAIGEGYIAMSAMSALGRQPGSSQKILRLMIIGQAITETAAIFALVMALVLLFGASGEGTMKAVTYIAAGIAIGFGTIGSGFGAGLPGGSALKGIGRNPENSDVLTVQMIIGQAVTQTSTIFALTVSLILITLNPEESYLKIFALLGGAFAMGFGAIGPGIGDGIVAKNANEAVGRSPTAHGAINSNNDYWASDYRNNGYLFVGSGIILIFVV